MRYGRGLLKYGWSGFGVGMWFLSFCSLPLWGIISVIHYEVWGGNPDPWMGWALGFSTVTMIAGFVIASCNDDEDMAVDHRRKMDANLEAGTPIGVRVTCRDTSIQRTS